MARPNITRVSNLEIKSDKRNKEKGLYPCAVTTVQRDAILTKTNGLIIFNIDTKTHQTFIDGVWNNLVMPGSTSILKRTSTAANYQISATDAIIGVDSSLAAVTVTLPLVANTTPGQIFTIKDEGGQANVNNITISRNGANIEGQANNRLINTAYGIVQYYSTGTAWFAF